MRCSTTQYKWQKAEYILENIELKPGDIIIKEKVLTPKGLLGHSAILLDNYMIGDYPTIGDSYYEVEFLYWIEWEREMIVLRLKNMNHKFKVSLFKNLKKYAGLMYKMGFDKENTSGFYCSQYIWYVYKITAEEFGYDLDLDSDKGLIIFPYDFLNSKDLISPT